MSQRLNKSIATISACVLSFSAPGFGFAQQQTGKALAQGSEAPPEVTISKHRFGSEARFVNQKMQTGGQEPPTQVVTRSVMMVSVQARNNGSKTVVGVSWYFALRKNENEDYFRIPFVTAVDIGPKKTRTFKGDIDRLPRRARAVTVEDLRNPVTTRPRERVVITCLIFSDGTSSSLNDTTKVDCRRLEASPLIQKKLQKL